MGRLLLAFSHLYWKTKDNSLNCILHLLCFFCWFVVFVVSFFRFITFRFQCNIAVEFCDKRFANVKELSFFFHLHVTFFILFISFHCGEKFTTEMNCTTINGVSVGGTYFGFDSVISCIRFSRQWRRNKRKINRITKFPMFH